MKNDIEKSLKRWLKNKVKITMSLVTAFLITGSIGYGEETGPLWGANIDKTVEGDLTVIANTQQGTKIGIGFNGKVDVSGKLTINAGSNGIESGYGENSKVEILANEIIINSGDNGIFVSKGEGGIFSQNKGYVKIGSEDRKINKLDITSRGQGIDNKKGKTEIYGTDNSTITIHSTGESGIDENQAAINNSGSGNNGIVTVNGGTISLVADNGNGITNGSGTTTINSKELNIDSSKGKLSSVDGIKNTSGIVNINSENNVRITSEGNGIYNNGKGEVKILTDSVLIGEIGDNNNLIAVSKNGIFSQASKYSAAGNVIIENKNPLNKNNNFNIAATEKTLYSDKGNITLSTSGNLNLFSESEDNNTFGIYATNAGNINLTGDTLNINSTGKDISVSEDFKYEGNNFTVSKLFNATQGIRLEEGATLNLDRIENMNIISSDIAVTANNSNFTFDGTSYFEGNDYLIQGYNNEHLLVRPVIQAVDNGNINLSGNTTVISRTGTDGEVDNVKINNVGIYSQGHTDVNTEGESFVNIEGNLTVISGNDVLEEKYDITELSELQKLTADQFKELISNVDISLMATAGGVINVNSNDNVFLIGDILAGKENSLISVKGGNGNPNSMVVIGEVLAANSGKVGLDMANGGYFVGRADDYFIIDEFKNTDFRNNKFSTDITSEGEVALRLGNGAIWNVIGQSYVTYLDFTEGSGVVDLTYEGNALRIKNLSGEGTFNLTLDSEHKDAGNMLYIYNVGNNIPDPVSLLDNNSKNEVLTQTVNLTDSILNLQAGEKLRFATLGKDATGKVQFVANEVKERGINNVSYNTENSAYDVSDEENTIYNGDESNNNKPGNDLINDNETTGFNATENWYLTRGEETINDIGTTIIEMSKANYAGAVYMDNLNKRLGDMTFANGKEGFWVRVRNDRVGEDSEYRLHNYMTQLGYDKPYPMEEGKGTEYRGIAFEISKGDMEYKNINGDANIDRQALWLYDTNIYNNGFYSDYVFRAGRMESEFDIYGRETGTKAEGTYKNLFLGASAEYGYRVDLSEKTYFEPQVQLQYTYIDGTDYSTNQDTKVELDEIHSVIGRVGARLGHDFYNDEGRKTTTLYAKADVNHEFLGEQRVEAKDLTGALDKKYENDGTWYDIGIGASRDITPDFNVYMDVERQIGRTRDDQSWQFNLGFRYVLGE